MHFDNTGLLLFQLLIILSTVKFFGFLFKKINQPAVIGEIIAGIVLGPSLVGALFPTTFGFVFPKESIGTLQQLSQIGLLLFMFIVGMEFDMEKLKGTAKQSLLVSSSSILFPFILGCIFAYFIFDETQPNHPSQFSFVLFVGISMSVTAFPVLIRILGERSMLQTPMGIFVTE